MENDIIEKLLRERFAAPMPKYYDRRIIFWSDTAGEFSEMIETLSLPQVKILRLTGDNHFYAKYLLHTVDTSSNYLVYDLLPYTKPEDDWLFDLKQMSETFRADLPSIRMEQLHIPDTPALYQTVKQYGKFFDSQKRVNKLVGMGHSYETPQQLKLDILAVLTGAAYGKPDAIIQSILSNGLDAQENEPLCSVRKFGDEQALWDMVENLTGWKASTKEVSLMPLAGHILITALSSAIGEKNLSAFSSMIAAEKQVNCYAIVDEWTASDKTCFLETAQQVETYYGVADVLEKVDTADLLKADCLPCVDVCIICRYMREISENIIKCDEIISLTEQRRTMRWYARYADFYDGLYYAAKLRAFCNTHGDGFHFGTETELWEQYCKQLYQMDLYYRKFQTAFQKSL